MVNIMVINKKFILGVLMVSGVTKSILGSPQVEQVVLKGRALAPGGPQPLLMMEEAEVLAPTAKKGGAQRMFDKFVPPARYPRPAAESESS